MRSGGHRRRDEGLPRNAAEPLLGRSEWTTIALTGALQAGVALAVLAWALESPGLMEARNLALSVLVFGELLRAFAARSTTHLFWEVGAFTNRRVLGVVLGLVPVSVLELSKLLRRIPPLPSKSVNAAQ